MADITSVHTLCAATTEAMRIGAHTPSKLPVALYRVADLLDYLACDADRALRFAHADSLSALATTIRASADAANKTQGA